MILVKFITERSVRNFSDINKTKQKSFIRILELYTFIELRRIYILVKLLNWQGPMTDGDPFIEPEIFVLIVNIINFLF